jgi:hypothetical protein
MRIARSLPLSDERKAVVVPLLKEAYPAADKLMHQDEQGSSNLDNQNVSYLEELQRKLKQQRIEQLQAEKAKLYIDMNVVP